LGIGYRINNPSIIAGTMMAIGITKDSQYFVPENSLLMTSDIGNQEGYSRDSIPFELDPAKIAEPPINFPVKQPPPDAVIIPL